MIKAIVFDMDGVLIDTERILGRAWVEIGKLYQVEDVEQTFHSCLGLNERDTKSCCLKEYGKDFPYDKFRDEASVLFYEIIEKEGLPVKKGVRELLDYLKKEGYGIGLASSSSKKNILYHMEGIKTIEYFDVIISGDMVTHSKPDPEIYQIACQKLGVLPEAAAAIEDSPNGIRSASQAGMKVMMVPDLIKPEPDLNPMLCGVFDSLLEVKDFLSEKRAH